MASSQGSPDDPQSCGCAHQAGFPRRRRATPRGAGDRRRRPRHWAAARARQQMVCATARRRQAGQRASRERMTDRTPGPYIGAQGRHLQTGGADAEDPTSGVLRQVPHVPPGEARREARPWPRGLGLLMYPPTGWGSMRRSERWGRRKRVPRRPRARAGCAQPYKLGAARRARDLDTRARPSGFLG